MLGSKNIVQPILELLTVWVMATAGNQGGLLLSLKRQLIGSHSCSGRRVKQYIDLPMFFVAYIFV
jgi:hypothetical protein